MLAFMTEKQDSHRSGRAVLGMEMMRRAEGKEEKTQGEDRETVHGKQQLRTWYQTVAGGLVEDRGDFVDVRHSRKPVDPALATTRQFDYAQPMEAPPKLDLSKYADEELIDRLMDLIDIPDQLSQMLKRFLVVLVLAPFATAFYLKAFGVAGAWWWAGFGYALVMGLGIGMLAAFLWWFRNVTEQCLGIAQLSAERSRMAVDDVRALEDGELMLPSGEELLIQTCEEVLMPALEKTLARSFGFLSTPVLFIYRHTVGRILRFAIARTVAKMTSSESKAQGVQDLRTGLALEADNLERLDREVRLVEAFLQRVDQATGKWVLAPAVIAFRVIAGLILFPLLVLPLFV